MFPDKLVATPSRSRVAEVSTATPKTIPTCLTIFKGSVADCPDVRSVASRRQGDSRYQALALKTPVAESMSVMAIFQQLGRRTLPIKPFQEKRDADADDKDWPDP